VLLVCFVCVCFLAWECSAFVSTFRLRRGPLHAVAEGNRPNNHNVYDNNPQRLNGENYNPLDMLPLRRTVARQPLHLSAYRVIYRSPRSPYDSMHSFSDKLQRSSGFNWDTTNKLIVANIFMFIFSIFDSSVIPRLAKINDFILEGEYYRLLSCLFAHGDVFHLASNMYSLQNLGKFVESVYGRRQFLAIYLLSGILANTFTYLMGWSASSIGASSSIYGLMGAMGMYYLYQSDALGERAQIGMCVHYVASLSSSKAKPYRSRESEEISGNDTISSVNGWR
jgi:membrane associated rhomboid family serine protease